MKIAEGKYNKNNAVTGWKYINGHTENEANGKLAYMVLTSKTNGNFLVVPSSVRVDDGRVDVVGNGGFFWLSSLDPQNVDVAWDGRFVNDKYGVKLDFRYFGLGVRGVVAQ